MTKQRTAADLAKDVKALKDEVKSHQAEVKKLKLSESELRSQLEEEIKYRKQLARNDEKYRQIIESIQEGYFETDLQGCITYCNQALVEISGYSREILIGADFQDFTPPRTTHAMRAVFGKVYKSGKDAKVSNYEVFHKNGHTLIIEFAAALIKDRNGEPAGFRVVLRDVSKQVKTADKEKRMQNQLQQAQKMEALGTLAGGLAHGFNNVLMAIQGNLSIIRMSLPPNHSVQEQLKRINQATEKGGRLAKEILSFAKVGKYVVMPTDLNKILKSTSRMFLRSHSYLQIHEIYEKMLWHTNVDRVQIGQVLLSLYMNAAESMPDGGDLHLRSENVHLDELYTKPFATTPGRYIKVSVTDSGKGLNDEAKRRIFEPFFSPYRPIRYEGLGLAAAYGTVKSHKGIINVYSEEGHGSTFNIYLPAMAREDDELLETRIDKGTETILIVDDDPLASQVGREILEHCGYRVIVADNGGEAVAIYEEYKEQIHLVLLDVILPDMDSEEVFFELKKCNANVLVVVASGYNVNRQISILLDYGCVDFVQKPFLSKNLSAKVRSALDKETVPPAVIRLIS